MADAYVTRLWGGRFHEDEDALMQRFNGNLRNAVAHGTGH